jgi:hypothetical protein
VAFKIKKTETVVITRDLAQKIYLSKTYETDRPLRKQTLENLRDKIRRHQTTYFDWSIAHCVENDEHIRVNGQHSSYLFSTEFEPDGSYEARISTYECDTMEDVATLWAQFDSQSSSRKQIDVIRPILANTCFFVNKKSKSGSNKTSHKSALAAMAAMSEVFFSSRGIVAATHEQKAQLAKENIDFCQWIVDLIDDGRKNDFCKHGVVVAMLQTYCEDKQKAEAFWKATILETDPIDTPTRCLSQALHNVRALDLHDKKLSKKYDAKDTWEFCKICMEAWALYRAGKSKSSKQGFKWVDRDKFKIISEKGKPRSPRVSDFILVDQIRASLKVPDCLK